VRTLRAITVAAGVAVVVVALAGSPAVAKGPRSATIDGPGLDAPIVDPEAGLSKLPALSGLYGPLWDDPSVPLVDQPPTRDLGPAYVITWDLGEYVDEAGRSSGSPDLVRQTFYPYAVGSPLVHTEAGQPFYGEETSGGWYVGAHALRDMLVDLGLPTGDEAEDLPAAVLPASVDITAEAAADPAPADDATANSATAGAATAVAADETGAPVADGGGAAWMLPVAVALGGLVAMTATGFGLVRRRSAVRTVDAV
jgi:hypothetical protein